MAESLIVETSFLIDLQRELMGGRTGPAIRFLGEHREDRLLTTPTVVGEFAAGLEDGERDDLQHFFAPFRIVPIGPEVGWHYSRIYRHLRDRGQLVGANDLWIAASARARDLPLLTRNEKHFRRVPDLRVVSYAA